MKRVWNVVAALAVVNLLALGGLLAWLKASNRIDDSRIQAIRERLAKTIDEEAAEKAAKEAEAKAAEARAAEAAKLARPPTSSSEKIAEQQFRDDQRTQVLLRQQQELENLRSSLMGQLAKLEDREKKLDADKKAFAEERKRIAEADGAKQFQVALATLEGQKPADAKKVLKALLDEKQTDQVVAYLAKMEEGKRAKVLGEFVKDDAAVAADLLEKLRTRGVAVPGRMGAAGAPAPSNSQVSANDAGFAGTTGGNDSAVADAGAGAGR
jgi:hypothetical protein